MFFVTMWQTRQFRMFLAAIRVLPDRNKALCFTVFPVAKNHPMATAMHHLHQNGHANELLSLCSSYEGHVVCPRNDNGLFPISFLPVPKFIIVVQVCDDDANVS